MRSSLFYSFLEKNATLFVNIATIIALSRLLTPIETGIFSVAAGFINITQCLRDFGIGNYIIKEELLTRQQLQSAMGLSLFMGFIFFLVFFSCANAISIFFNEPKLKLVIVILSMNFLVVAAASVGTARLSRVMNYRAMSLINFASTITFTAVSITLAAEGYGAVAIAWASCLGVVTIVVGQIIAMKSDAFIRPSVRGWQPLIRFGLFASGNGMLSTVIQRGPDILIGRLMGFVDAGLFSRGNSLITLFETALIASVRPVVASGLATLRREGRDIETPLLQCYSYLSAVAWPFLSVLALLAHPIILIMFGDQWLQSIAPARWLCLAALFGTITNICMMAFTSIGAMQTMFLVQCITSALVVMAVTLACFISLQAVAIAIVASGAVSAMISLHMIKATFGVSILTILQSTVRSLAVTVATTLPPTLVLVVSGFLHVGLWISTLVAATAAAAAWVLALWKLGHPLWRELFELVSKRHTDVEPTPRTVDSVV